MNMKRLVAASALAAAIGLAGAAHAATYDFSYLSTSGPITLDITEVGSAVPEPSLWALMIAGVGMVGGMFRIGRRQGWALGGATA